ncbi:hypothetical protein C8T65DRAFT_638167 [Cerioporus squamosus]|nr:hypothetical protein C8T65DRAFT_638167 [Cerioporus squamosus]
MPTSIAERPQTVTDNDVSKNSSQAKEEHFVSQCNDTAWGFPTSQEIREELYNEYTPEQKEKAWAEASEAVKTYHDELVRRWKEEMDALLVYAGLFSAVLTAFNVQSYQLLQPAPCDPTIAILQQISAQLSSFTITPPFINSTGNVNPLGTSQPSFHAPASMVWLNTLWFSSLVFSLASASIALFVKQWLQEATVQGSTRDSARLRQYRLNGLLKWRVGAITVALPIMLQLAAVLFLIGLMVLLWTLHRTVAAITSSLIAILFAFFLTVVLLPVLKPDCSYRCPASVALYAIVRYTRNAALRKLRHFCRLLCLWHASLISVTPNPHISRLRRFAYRRLGLDMPTWRGRDQRHIREHVSALDRAIVTTAYTATSDPRFVSYMPTIFPDLPPDEVAKCFHDMYNFEQEHWGVGTTDEALRKNPTVLPFLVVYGLRHMLTRTDKGCPAWQEDIPFVCRRFCLPIETSADQRYADIACRTLCQLAVEDPSRSYFFKTSSVVLSYMYGERGARHSYDTLCHVRAMVEHRMETGTRRTDFEGFREDSIVIYSLLQCIHQVASGRAQLSPAQTHRMLAWGRETLPRIQQRLHELEWRGSHVGCLSCSAGSETSLAFPHIASGYLVKYIIDPLLDVCSTKPGLDLVSKELVDVVEWVWSSVQVAYPIRVTMDDVGFIWCSGLEVIDARLAELRAAVVGRIPAAQIARKRIIHPL